MRKLLERFATDEDGLEMVEWCMAAVLIVTASAATFYNIGPAVNLIYTQMLNTFALLG